MDCPVHGKQLGGLLLKVQPTPEAEAVMRKYCGMCVMAALDDAIWKHGDS
jgi:hypothetical protein